MTIAEITIDDPTATLEYIQSMVTVIGYIIAGIFINLYVKRKKIVEAETRRANEKAIQDYHALTQEQFQQRIQQPTMNYGVNQQGAQQ